MEWTVQVQNIRETAAAEAAKANKDDGEVDKVGSKQAKLKPKQTTCKAKGKQKGTSSKKVDLPDNNLDEYFSSSQDKGSQETADVTPSKTPKKSEGAKSKDVPKSSSHGRVHKSPQGSAGEGSPEPSSKSKQQVMKPESEDSSSSSSSSRDSGSSDEEKVCMKEEMKELPPPPPRKHRKHSKSRSRSCTPT